MIANYHTHTPRCRHAEGNEEEYIRTAIELGMQELGFSDHAPQPFPGDYYSIMRMYPEQLEEYTQTLRRLQAKYADQIKIHIGLEVEYYPALFEELLAWVRQTGVEYMILGQHWPGNEEGERHVYRPFADAADLARYVDQTIEAMYTGLFTYFAHPDLPQFEGDARVYDRQMRRLIRAAKRSGTPLEINLHGYRCGCTYPNRRFWELVAQEDAPVVLGRDAHSPEELRDDATEQVHLELVQSLGLSLLDRVPLRKP